MKSFLRMFATLIMACGLIAGSLGVAMAGGEVDPPDVGGIDTSGGEGGRGGNADAGGGNNDGDIDQDNEQEQNQDGDQDQDVDQDNDNNLGQDNTLTGNAGGSVSTSCSANQPDGSLDATDDDDEGTGGTGDVTSGDDSAECTVGDSSVGDSSTGDSNQANAGEQDASNSNAQDFDQTGGNQANAPSADLDQDAGNEANAGDGGAGGGATNSGSVNFTTEITTILIRILDSILSGGDTIIVGGDDDDDDTAELEAFCEGLEDGDDADNVIAELAGILGVDEPDSAEETDELLINSCASVGVTLEIDAGSGLIDVID